MCVFISTSIVILIFSICRFPLPIEYLISASFIMIFVSENGKKGVDGDLILKHILVWILAAVASSFLSAYIYSIVKLIFISDKSPKKSVIKYFVIFSFITIFGCVICFLEAGLFRIHVDIPAYISALIALTVGIIGSIIIRIFYIPSLRIRLDKDINEVMIVPNKRSEILRTRIYINIK